jgi:hypothetical protein
MLEMVAAGIFLCIGFWLGKKICNAVEYHSYIQGDKLQKGFKSKVKPTLNKCIWSIQGAYRWHKDNLKKSIASKRGA